MKLWLSPRWYARPTAAAFYGSALAIQVLIWMITPARDARPPLQATTAPGRQHLAHIVFCRGGVGGEPISHCKMLVRYRWAGRMWNEYFWMEDDECTSRPVNEWMEPDGSLAWGFVLTAHELRTVFWILEPQQGLEIMFVPQSES